MGYSIQTVFPNQESQDCMFKFLKENYQDWEKLNGESDEALRYIRGPVVNTSYPPDDKEFLIGFDYSAGDLDRAYVHAICGWMALMVLGAIVNYDGAEDLPIEAAMSYSLGVKLIEDELKRLTELYAGE
jgi:hypothetical protein